ncbi:polyprenyl synthetase family protein [Opitutales bacterium]|nr:polyprenyl synthetase family protein [Opitutales bacterium]
MNFIKKLKNWQELINNRLDQALPAAHVQPKQLHHAIRHSMSAGGKRLRPILVMAAHEIFPGDLDPMPAALAIECIHTYSLIHDDLPAMDNSDLRRGKPSCHKAFDEATAILAGDALQPLAFEILSSFYFDDPELALDLIQILARTSGSKKLVGGQMQDLLAEGSTPDEEILSYIHTNKTAAMIEASLQMGFRIGGKGRDMEKISLIGKVGNSLGLAFQAVDDLLDITQTSDQLGKDAHHDNQSGKVTWISLKGKDEARRLAREHSDKALESLTSIGGESGFLSELIDYMLNRKF